MTTIFDVPIQAFLGQLLIGLINGSFYAMLSLGLAIIFGMLKIINFAHGAQYMIGAFAGYLLLATLGIGYWPALILAPIVVGLCSAVIERLALSRLYNLDHPTACSSPSARRSPWRAPSATSTAPPGNPCGAQRAGAQPGLHVPARTAPGWCWPRW